MGARAAPSSRALSGDTRVTSIAPSFTRAVEAEAEAGARRAKASGVRALICPGTTARVRRCTLVVSTSHRQATEATTASARAHPPTDSGRAKQSNVRPSWLVADFAQPRAGHLCLCYIISDGTLKPSSRKPEGGVRQSPTVPKEQRIPVCLFAQAPSTSLASYTMGWMRTVSSMDLPGKHI